MVAGATGNDYFLRSEAKRSGAKNVFSWRRDHSFYESEAKADMAGFSETVIAAAKPARQDRI